MSPQSRSMWNVLRTREGIFSLCLGSVFVLFNFSILLRHLTVDRMGSDSTLGTFLASILQFPKLLQSNKLLYECMVICFVGLWLYLAVLILLSFVRGSIQLGTYGLLAIFGGICSITILMWLLLLAKWIIWAIAKIVSLILIVLHAVFIAFRWVVNLIGDLIKFLFHYLWPVLLLAAVIVLIVLIVKAFGKHAIPVGTLIKRLLIVTSTLFALYLLIPIIAWIYKTLLLPFSQWCLHVLGILFGWLPKVIIFLVEWLLILLALVAACMMCIGLIGSIGYLLFDGFRGAWESGKSHKGVILTSFTLGSSLALILLVSLGRPEIPLVKITTETRQPAPEVKQVVQKRGKRKQIAHPKGQAPVLVQAATIVPTPTITPGPPISLAINQAYAQSSLVLPKGDLTNLFAASLPQSVQVWAIQTFKSASAPTFDAILLIIAIALSLLGLCRGLFSRDEIKSTVKFYNRDFLALLVIPIFMVISLFALSEINQDS